jgi:RecJ-like exonuclease
VSTYSFSLPHGDVDDSTSEATCPECGERADFEECVYCNGRGMDGLYQRCFPCDGQGGHYYCDYGCEEDADD